MSLGTYLADGSWHSTSTQFKSLTADEVEQYRQYARDEDPPSDNWEVFHPVCREVWEERGVGPLSMS